MLMDHPIRVLQVTIGDGSFGGVTSFLYTFYSRMDHAAVHFDFLYCGENSMRSKEADPVLEGSAVTALHILKRNNNGIIEYKKLYKALKEIFDKNGYDIVHVNSGNAFLNACIAYLLDGRAVYISHSHNASPAVRYSGRAKSLIKTLLKNSIRGYIIEKADALYACSDQAGINLFGEKGIRLEKYKVINNAIDTERFRFDQQVRQSIRKDDKVIIGFVGRLSDQKNPLFAVDVFAEFHKKRPDSVLWMVGEGELRNALEKKIDESGLRDHAVLFGRRDDVQDLMQAMDVLIFPSAWEGLGIAAIEAQCSGLSVLASDRVPKAANVAGLITYLPLSLTADDWAEKMEETVTDGCIRRDMSLVLKNAQFDISSEAELLEENYKDLCSRFQRKMITDCD